jgi:hypothetical protein
MANNVCNGINNGVIIAIMSIMAICGINMNNGVMASAIINNENINVMKIMAYNVA